MVIRGEGGLAQAEIRRRNLSRMLRALHLDGPMSRSDLAIELNLNRSTVASLISDLVERRLVLERSRTKGLPQAPGRPSPVVELRLDGPRALAIDLATDWIGAAVIGLGGSVIASARREQSLANADPAQIVDELHDLVEPMLLRLQYGPRIVAIGASIPGAVRAADGHLMHAPNLGWRDIPLGDLIRKRFGSLGVPVFVGNDADLAASAEVLHGSGRGSNDFICLWGEGGIGAGFVVGGRALGGAAGYAGEVGHLTVNPNGDLCHCGSRGCWEAEVGEEALLRRSGRDRLGGAAAVAGLLAAADRGDEITLAALAESGRWLGIGIAGLVNIFNPSRVALGGLSARIYPYAKEALLRELNSRAMPAARAMLELTTARLGAAAPLIGASELAFAPILQDPTIVPLSRDADPVDFRRQAGPPQQRWIRAQPAQGGDSRLEFSANFP